MTASVKNSSASEETKVVFVAMSHKLNQEQIADLHRIYGDIEIKYFSDENQKRFSNVDPKATPFEIMGLAYELCDVIIAQNVDVVICAGEQMLAMSMNIILHNWKYAEGKQIDTLSATTERVSVEKDGIKTSVFKHVRFRNLFPY